MIHDYNCNFHFFTENDTTAGSKDIISHGMEMKVVMTKVQEQRTGNLFSDSANDSKEKT